MTLQAGTACLQPGGWSLQVTCAQHNARCLLLLLPQCLSLHSLPTQFWAMRL
jgi:hypothetical protein